MTTPTVISSETMTLYCEVQRLESILASSRKENSILRKKLSKIIAKTNTFLDSKVLKSASKANAKLTISLSKQKAKFELEKAKFFKMKSDYLLKIKNQKTENSKKLIAKNLLKKENLLKAKAAKAAKSAQLKLEKAEFLTAKKAKLLKEKVEKAEKLKIKKAKLLKEKVEKAEKLKIKKAEILKAKVEKAEKLKIKKAEILKAKSEKFLQSKLKKAEIAKSKAEISTGKVGLKGDIRIQAILENKKRLIKKYNEISFGEDQILLITPLKNGMIKKMISEKKKKIREDLKIRKIQLSVEMKKVVQDQ